MGKVINFVLLLILLLPSTAISSTKISLKKDAEFYKFKNPDVAFSPENLVRLKEDIKGGFFDHAVVKKTTFCLPHPGEYKFVYKDSVDKLKIYNESFQELASYKFSKYKKPTSNFWIVQKLSFSEECNTLFIEYQIQDVLNFNAHLYSDEQLSSDSRLYIFMHSFFYVFFSVLLFISIVFLIKFRSPIYFWFSSVLITQDFLGGTLLNGFLTAYILSPHTLIEYDVGNIFAPLMNISVTMLALSIARAVPKPLVYIAWGFITSQALVVSPLILNIFVPGLHSQSAVISMIINHSILISCILAVVIAATDLKNSLAQLFVAGTGVKLFGQFLKTLLLQGDIPSELWGINSTELLLFNISYIGSMIEGFFFLGIIVIKIFSEIKEQQSQLLQLNGRLKDAEADIRVSKLSSQLIHDLRRPFTQLDMGIRIMKESKDKEDLTQTLNLTLEEVSKARASIEDMIRDIKNTKDKTPISRSEVKIYDLIQNEINILPKPKDKNIDFEIACDRTLTFRLDKEKISRVIFNLCLNAIQAIKQEGKIKISGEISDRNLVLKISNSGSSIPSDKIDDIFDEDITFNKEHGTGLGLFIVRNFVQNHGGTIEVSSDQNFVEFVIVLP